MSEAAALTTGPEQTEAAELDQQLGRHVAAAQQRMARAVLVGKLQNDPLADLVDAMAQALGVQHEIHRASVHQQREATAQLEQQLRAAIEEARRPVDPAALVRLEEAAATGADGARSSWSGRITGAPSSSPRQCWSAVSSRAPSAAC